MSLISAKTTVCLYIIPYILHMCDGKSIASRCQSLSLVGDCGHEDSAPDIQHNCASTHTSSCPRALSLPYCLLFLFLPSSEKKGKRAPLINVFKINKCEFLSLNCCKQANAHCNYFKRKSDKLDTSCGHSLQIETGLSSVFSINKIKFTVKRVIKQNGEILGHVMMVRCPCGEYNIY